MKAGVQARMDKAQVPCLIGIALIQDPLRLLVQGVLWRPTQQADVIPIQDHKSPGCMRREGIVAGSSWTLHPEACVQYLQRTTFL